MECVGAMSSITNSTCGMHFSQPTMYSHSPSHSWIGNLQYWLRSHRSTGKKVNATKDDTPLTMYTNTRRACDERFSYEYGIFSTTIASITSVASMIRVLSCFSSFLCILASLACMSEPAKLYWVHPFRRRSINKETKYECLRALTEITNIRRVRVQLQQLNCD